jgi:hypothetical protein
MPISFSAKRCWETSFLKKTYFEIFGEKGYFGRNIILEKLFDMKNVLAKGKFGRFFFNLKRSQAKTGDLYRNNI